MFKRNRPEAPAPAMMCSCSYAVEPHVIEWCSPSPAAWRLFETKTLDRWAGRGAEMGS